MNENIGLPKNIDLSFLEWNESKNRIYLNQNGHEHRIDDVYFLTIHGSHLYGLNNEDSDIDLKGIYAQRNVKNLVFGNGGGTISLSSGKEDSKNSSEDWDIELIEAQKFSKDLCKSQPYALELLFSPENYHLIQSKFIKELKKGFQNKIWCDNLGPFVGYIRSMQSKYRVKGDRLKALKHVRNKLDSDNFDRLYEVLGGIDFTQNHIQMVTKNLDKDGNKDELLEVADKQFNKKDPVQKVLVSIENTIDKYGHRAEKDVDWKALSHSFRLVEEAKDLIKNGKMDLPLKNNQYIQEIKKGNRSYKESTNLINEMVDEVDRLKEKTEFPEENPDSEWVKEKAFNHFYKSALKKLFEGSKLAPKLGKTVELNKKTNND